jgi:hypothetical protein
MAGSVEAFIAAKLSPLIASTRNLSGPPAHPWNIIARSFARMHRCANDFPLLTVLTCVTAKSRSACASLLRSGTHDRQSMPEGGFVLSNSSTEGITSTLLTYSGCDFGPL